MPRAGGWGASRCFDRRGNGNQADYRTDLAGLGFSWSNALRSKVLITACRLTLSRAARSSSSRNIPCVKSTFTRRTGRTTENSLVKWLEISSPRVAISAISSGEGPRLDLIGIGFLFLSRRFPGGDQTIRFSRRISPDLKDNGTQATAGPTNRTILLRIVTLPVDQIDLIKNLLRLLQADSVFPPDVSILLSIELESHRGI